MLAIALLCGLAIPIVLDPEDGLQMLVSIKATLTGHGVNEGLAPFGQLNRPYLAFPVLEALVVFALAMAGLIVGVVRRAPVPVVFGAASVLLALMALARYNQTYYLAPAYVTAIPGALWLLRSSPRRATPLLVACLLTVVLVPQLRHRDDLTRSVAHTEAEAAALDQAVAPLSRPGTVVLTPIENAQTQWGGFVQFYGSFTPAYAYRFVEPWVRIIQLVRTRGFRIRYYAGPEALHVNGTADVDLPGLGTARVRRLRAYDRPGNGFGVLEIVRLPRTL
jgi:hypothetical protein